MNFIPQLEKGHINLLSSLVLNYRTIETLFPKLEVKTRYPVGDLLFLESLTITVEHRSTEAQEHRHGEHRKRGECLIYIYKYK